MSDCQHEPILLPEVVARQRKRVCRLCGEFLGTLVQPAPIPTCSREGCRNPGIWIGLDDKPTCDFHANVPSGKAS